MKPANHDEALLVCKSVGCTWTYAANGVENPSEIARYHAIQVHNNQQAVREGRF